MISKKYISLGIVLALMGSFVLAAPAMAQKGEGKMMSQTRPAVVGTVSAVSGNTVTVVSKREADDNSNVATTYTVDATNAKILRGQTVIAVSNIAVGDTVIVQGAMTGTNVVATVIRDGKVGNGNGKDNNQALLQIQGNGQPVVAGTISAISGNTITVTNSGSATYTIDATSAKIVQGKNTISVSGLKIGDSVIVQGAVNGNAVTASTIIDQAKPAGAAAPRMGFFGSVGQFFKHLFGF